MRLYNAICEWIESKAAVMNTDVEAQTDIAEDVQSQDLQTETHRAQAVGFTRG